MLFRSGFTNREVTAQSGFKFSKYTGGVTYSSTQSPPNSAVPIVAEATTPSGVSAQQPIQIDTVQDKGEQ